VAVSKKDRMRSARRGNRVTLKVRRDAVHPRVSVCRSLKHIYAQIIDDINQRTLVSFSSLKFEVVGDKKTIAHAIGLELAKRAQKEGIEQVVFDRGKRKYHGRVKAIAEGMREGGMKF